MNNDVDQMTVDWIVFEPKDYTIRTEYFVKTYGDGYMHILCQICNHTFGHHTDKGACTWCSNKKCIGFKSKSFESIIEELCEI